MDRFTIRNLELYASPHQNATTLIDVIDQTMTAMGSRLLKRWLALPLKDQAAITKRHDVLRVLRHNQSYFKKFLVN
jgi:DNA mismatch repair protein MutS